MMMRPYIVFIAHAKPFYTPTAQAHECAKSMIHGDNRQELYSCNSFVLFRGIAVQVPTARAVLPVANAPAVPAVTVAPVSEPAAPTGPVWRNANDIVKKVWSSGRTELPTPFTIKRIMKSGALTGKHGIVDKHLFNYHWSVKSYQIRGQQHKSGHLI